MRSLAIVGVIGMTVWISLSACSGIQVGQQLYAGRNALQTGRPDDAVGFLIAAAAADPHYRIPYRVPVGVLTYLGRAYYETGRNKEAQQTLEKAVRQDPSDHLARVYLGLALLRNGEFGAGRKQVEAGLRGLYDTLDYLAADNISGPFWDPAGMLRSDITTTLTTKTDNALLIASAERIGREFDEEIDEARRDEERTRSRGSGGGD